MSDFSEAELEAFLDEALNPERSSQIEKAMREDAGLQVRLSYIRSRRDAGVHSVAEIWRVNELGVPSREQLGSYLLGVLEDDLMEYIDFRINVLECRRTIANLSDLQSEQQVNDQTVEDRRSRYLQSSAGYFKSEERETE